MATILTTYLHTTLSIGNNCALSSFKAKFDLRNFISLVLEVSNAFETLPIAKIS